MEGWGSVEELTRWGFTHAPVVMANEAHSGLTRCIRTREIGIRIIQAAHRAGVRRLAMEALARRQLTRPYSGHPADRRWLPSPAGHAQAHRDGAGAGLELVGLRGRHRHWQRPGRTPQP